MRIFKPLRKDKEGKPRRYQKWYAEFKCHRSRLRRVTAFADKKASEELGRKLEKLVAARLTGGMLSPSLSAWAETLPVAIKKKLVEFDLLSPETVASSKSLAEHIADYKRYLKSNQNTRQHIRLVIARVEKIADECGFEFWSDITHGKAIQCLSDMREGKNGISIQTSNHYLVAIKSFCSWMVKDGRAMRSPVQHISRLNPRTDRRHDRRELSPEEIRLLLEATRNGEVVHGMTGHDREMLYRLALETGLRWAELRSLKPSSFSFDSRPPTVMVEAAYSKRRREDTLPLRPETARELKDYLAMKLPSSPAFPMWKGRGAEMLREDLEAADIEYKDESGRFADFHSLRHSYISNLARSGVHPKVAQSLARHSTITLTMDRYCHTRLEDQVEALELLPDISCANQ
ncbi:MAG: tyrosine-type recombinase/integrase [Thermodesulfobacteriota bacterium]|nr:tyrosine-type recombinase/integrase [Thermodesulfobacteriota bacterium]